MQADWLKTLPIQGSVQVEPLYEGVANQVFWLQASTDTYVLKVFCHDHPYGLNREQEVSLQRQLAAQGMAPSVLHFDAARGLLLQPFIHEPDLKRAPIADSDRIRQVAETLARIHTVQVDAPLWSLRERIDTYLAALMDFDREAASQLRKKFKPLQRQLDCWSAHPVFCHNDLALHHIFATRPCLVIDWEYAGFGERLFDLANCILINRYSRSEAQSLVNAYEGFSGLTLARDQLDAWIQVAGCVNELWYELHHQLQRQAAATDKA